MTPPVPEPIRFERPSNASPRVSACTVAGFTSDVLFSGPSMMRRAGHDLCAGRLGVMSKPPFLELPKCARAVVLETGRGRFAAHLAEPEAKVGAQVGAMVGAHADTALLVPGYTGSKEDFIGLLAPLAAAGLRVTAVDLRGQYETGGPDVEKAYELPELGRDLLALAEALAGGAAGRPSGGPAGRVHLLGHSFGGLVAREAVLLEPGMWASLTLMSSGPAAVHAAEAERLRMLLEALPVLDLEEIWQAMQRLDGADGAEEVPVRAPEQPGIAEFLHRRWLAQVPAALQAMGRQLLCEPDRVSELAAVAPARLVVSGEEDRTWPVAWQTEMAERLGAERRIVRGAGHSPNAELPAATARLLSAFWRSVS
jgi:pimeloyl-ACP methyl ester carboxylesterase